MFETNMNGTKKRFFEDSLRRSGSTIIVNKVETKALIKQLKDNGAIGENTLEVYIPIEIPIKALDTFTYNGQEYLIKIANAWEEVYTRCLVNPLYQTINVKYSGYPTWQFKVCPTDESVAVNDSNTNITYTKILSTVFLKRDDISKQIQRGTRFFLYGTVYKVYGITYANSSILKLYCEVDGIGSLDDVENEIADNSSIIPSKKTYSITASSGANGSIAPSGEVSVKQGSSKTFTFNPSSGYTLDKVIVDGQEVQVLNNQYTFEKVMSNHTISVTFKEIPTATYMIVSSVNGNGSINPLGETLLSEGQSQTYTIIPNEGYRVSSVIVDGSEVQLVDSTYTFENVTSNHTITVSFIALVVYSPRIKVGYNGTLRINGETISEGDTQVVTVYEGKNTILEIIPNEGYRLKDVKISSTDYTSKVINNQLVITDDMAEMAEYYALTVTFEVITYYTITASSSGNCSITPEGRVQVEEAYSQSFTISVNEGEVAILKVDEAEVQLEGDTYTFSNVVSNHTIEVSTNTNSVSYQLKGVTSSVSDRHLKYGVTNTINLCDEKGEQVEASSIIETIWSCSFEGDVDVSIFKGYGEHTNVCHLWVGKSVPYGKVVTVTGVVDGVTVSREFIVAYN